MCLKRITFLYHHHSLGKDTKEDWQEGDARIPNILQDTSFQPHETNVALPPLLVPEKEVPKDKKVCSSNGYEAGILSNPCNIHLMPIFLGAFIFCS